MATFYAQHYDLHASGFYFNDAETYSAKMASITNDFGDPVEEFEIQFIDGEQTDCELAKAIGLNQANLRDFIICVETWELWQKTNVIIAVGECGHEFDPQIDPDHYWLDVYYVDSLRELAAQFVEDGLFGDIPDNLQCYIDLDAIARDLGMDYSETTIGGERLVYRCA